MFEFSILSYSLILAGTMVAIPIVMFIVLLVIDLLWSFINREKSLLGKKIFDKLFCSYAIEQYKDSGWGKKCFFGYCGTVSDAVWVDDWDIKKYCLFSTKEKAEARWKDDDQYFKWEIWWCCPVLIAFTGVCLQYIPVYFLLFISAVGVLVFLRSARDLQKYVGKVKNKLDVHIEDKDAHK